MTSWLADGQHNHSPPESSPNPTDSGGGTTGTLRSAPPSLHAPLPLAGVCQKTPESWRPPAKMNGAVCALGPIYPGSAGTGRAGAILGNLPRCN